MLKIKIFAAVFAIVMTLLTIYAIPVLSKLYVDWTASLNQQQLQWFHYSQAIVGLALAGLAFWRWRVQRKKLK